MLVKKKMKRKILLSISIVLIAYTNPLFDMAFFAFNIAAPLEFTITPFSATFLHLTIAPAAAQ